MSAGGTSAWRSNDGGLLLRMRLTPKGGRDAIDDMIMTPEGPALSARVRAAPENNAANAALERLIAEWLDVPRSSVAIVSGHKSRLKSVSVAGDSCELAARAAACLAATGRGPTPR
jgi:uncharacterized protein YggU (UPF0235/DUF167 family)